MKVTRLRLIALSVSLTAIVIAGVVGARSLGAKVDDRDPDSLLRYADSLSWNNNWIKAEPFYHQAELLFAKQHRDSKALYAHVSQIPPNSESSSLTATIFQLTNDLALPAAADPETRLRILTIRGMSETNYDAASARSTWEKVTELARSRGHLQLAMRATGEQGIAAFILGDTNEAKKDVLEAWTSAKVLHDPAGIRSGAPMRLFSRRTERTSRLCRNCCATGQAESLWTSMRKHRCRRNAQHNRRLLRWCVSRQRP